MLGPENILKNARALMAPKEDTKVIHVAKPQCHAKLEKGAHYRVAANHVTRMKKVCIA